MMNSAIRQTKMSPLEISARIDFPVRQLDLEFTDNIAEFWYSHNALLTGFMAALSSAFPDGERQFIHSVRLYQAQIQDSQLLKQVRAFIGQEAHHGKEHDQLNDLMRRRGYPVDRIYKRFKKMNRMMQARLSPAHQLASTVCMEHLTAILSDYFISKKPEHLNHFDPHLRKIWAWHAIEETEHKAVAFDVYQSLVNRPYFLRLIMLETTFFFVVITSRGTYEMLKHTRQQRNIGSWLYGLNYLLGPKGVVSQISRDYLDFFALSFHPWQHDNRVMAEQLKQKYAIH
ncbi:MULTISPECIES: metal-dependent hydrolase [unclassified Acinetobacter]|uniref:metal-dependent hydrolase n=1 Tax=unclassified Acinetobacter TaxID=196816 RepID=UPI00190D25F8|nr:MULTISPECIES: metal-dependent hydrolase [unclassified Acinetobacter]MBK0064119.1 metal-dependent hydrolase [Acinetobacter sp. S55]MBK0067372.1 metal-dependent hydrolase [Acinetobacter sp. S54]